MNAEKIKTLLLGMASLNRMLIAETQGDSYWEAVTDEFNTYLCFAGTELGYALNAEADTEELPAVVCENFEDTREFPPIVVYDKFGNEVVA